MATKVGGFTKSGVVQCVNLVEESSIEMFNGTVSSNIITLNNGMKITFTYGPSDTPAGYTQTGSYLSFKDNTYGTPFLRLDIHNTSTDKRVLASITNEEAWNSSEDLSIGMISGSIGAAVPSAPCKWVIEYKGQTDTYSISSRGPIITNAVGGNTLITSANRTQTVRMCKDGTLKCKELIEEEVTSNLSSFNGTKSGNFLILNNGWKIQMYDSVNTSNQDALFTSIIDFMMYLDTDDTQGHLFFTPGSSEWTASVNNYSANPGTGLTNEDLWLENTDFHISGINVNMKSLLTTNFAMSIEIPGKSTYIYKCTDVDTSAYTAIFTPQSTSDEFDLTYSERVNLPTVRVYKDGTIRCAEVEEATVTQLRSNWGTPTKTSGRAEFTFPNGYVLRLRQQSTSNSMSLADTAAYAFRMSTSSKNGQTCMVLYKNTTTSQTTVPNYTVYDAFFEEGNSIAYCACTNPNMSFSGVYYLELLNSKGDIVGSLSNQSSSSYLFYAGTAFDVPVFDRISYSWPGSTIVKATNTFITSDNKTFLTNTGDQFMVR